MQGSPYRRLGKSAAVLGVLVPIGAMMGAAWGSAIVRVGSPLWIPLGIDAAMEIRARTRAFDR
ncbi:MAG: hypothetical protein AB7L28_19615, partial [Kofleriaceae bacterium]